MKAPLIIDSSTNGFRSQQKDPMEILFFLSLLMGILQEVEESFTNEGALTSYSVMLLEEKELDQIQYPLLDLQREFDFHWP